MKRLLVISINIAIYLFILSPVLIVIPVSFSKGQYVVFPPQGFSFRWYQNFFGSPELMASMVLSLKLGALSTLIGSSLGIMTALALTRYRLPGRDWLRAIFMAPLVIPGLVLGIALLIFFSRISLAGKFFSLLIAHTIIVLPFVIRAVTSSLVGIDETLELAAMSLGATPMVAFRTVTLPLLKAGVAAGAIFAFVTSFDELVMTLFLSGPHLTTLPVQMYTYLQYTSDPTIAAISVILIGFTTTAVLITERAIGFGQLI